MSKRETYGERVLTDTLSGIAEQLRDDLDVYLIGGGAMMFYDLKPATKDIDIVFLSQGELEAFMGAAINAGIKLVEAPSVEYKNIGATVIMRADSGIQLDLFNRVVCNAMEVTGTVAGRASHHRDMGKLHIYLMSREDIALFKSITERESDLEDIRTLIEAGIDWDIIEEECINQKDSGIWTNLLLDKLSDLYERYGITVRLSRVKEHADAQVLRKAFTDFMGEGERKFRDIFEIVHDRSGYSETWTRVKLKELEDEGFIESRKSGRSRLYRLKQ